MKDPVKEYKLYDGEIKLCFNPTEHKYTVDNKVVFGVTSVINILEKKALLYWAVNKTVDYLQDNLRAGEELDEVKISELLKGAKYAHRQVATKAATIGDIVHNWLEEYITAKLNKTELPKMPVNKEAQNCIREFGKWVKQNKVKFLASERKIYSKKYEYAGTLDTEAIVNGKLSVIDFKTSKAIYPDMFLQTSAYIKAREEESGKKYQEAWIIRIPKDGTEVDPQKTENIEEYFNAFLSCLNLYRWKMKLQGEAILKKAKAEGQLKLLKKEGK